MIQRCMKWRPQCIAAAPVTAEHGSPYERCIQGYPQGNINPSLCLFFVTASANSLLRQVKIMLRACQTLKPGRPSLLATYSGEGAEALVSTSIKGDLIRPQSTLFCESRTLEAPLARRTAHRFTVFRARGTLKWNKAGKSSSSAVGSNLALLTRISSCDV